MGKHERMRSGESDCGLQSHGICTWASWEYEVRGDVINTWGVISANSGDQGSLVACGISVFSLKDS